MVPDSQKQQKWKQTWSVVRKKGFPFAELRLGKSSTGALSEVTGSVWDGIMKQLRPAQARDNNWGSEETPSWRDTYTWGSHV